MSGNSRRPLAVLLLLLSACPGGPASSVPDACVPATCTSLGVVCGRAADGCGARLDCGACDPPLVVDAGPGCQPLSCADQEKSCGRTLDGCGAILDCGRCSGTDVCGRPGMPNVCVACTPMTDQELCTLQSSNCGVISLYDNCNRLRSVSCGGECLAPETCGGAGVPWRCGCARPTGAEVCDAAGATCGTVTTTDRCGVVRTDSCGACQAWEVCGAAGVPNRCGCRLDPQPTLCADAGVECGPLVVRDHCFVQRSIDCGGCTAPAVCGGAGVAGRCGVCVPESDSQLCAARKKDCGALQLVDQCGTPRTAQCGTCASPRVCGTNVANVCSTDPRCTVEVAPVADGGVLSLGTTRGFAAICGTDVAVANGDLNAIEIMDVATGVTRARYPLTSQPYRPIFDRDTGVLYVGLLGATAMAMIDLVDAGVRTVALPAPITDLALGNGGRVFAALDRSSPAVSVVDTTTATVTATLAVFENDLITFNRARSELITGSNSGGLLRRFLFDPSGLTLTQLQLGGGGANCQRLSISPDSARLALSCGHGNDFGYRTLDWAADNLGMSYGAFDIGAYPIDGHFSSDSLLFVATNSSDSISLFQVSNHVRVARFSNPSLFSCSYYSLHETGISPGATVVFGRTDCGFDSDSSRIYWWAYR